MVRRNEQLRRATAVAKRSPGAPGISLARVILGAATLALSLGIQPAAPQNTGTLGGTIPASWQSVAPATQGGLQLEHYSPFTGSLTASIPLHHVGGRGEAALDLVWNLQLTWMAWKETSGPNPFIPVDPYPGTYPNAAPSAQGLGAAGGVYSRTGGTNVVCGAGSAPGVTVTALVFVTGTGTQVDLVENATNGAPYTVPNPCSSGASNWDAGRGTMFHSTDGSRLQFTSDTAILDWNPNGGGQGTAGHGRALVSGNLVFPNGITYRIENSAVRWIRDRNGNQLTLLSNGPSYALDWYVNIPAVTQITDSRNQTTTINYNDPGCNGCTSVTYPGAGGSARTFHIQLANLSAGLLRSGTVSVFGALFPQAFQASYNFDPILAQSIQMPDGSQYSFHYNQYGEIARIDLPTGGAVEYDFGDGHNGSQDGFEGSPSDGNPVMIYRRLKERREYAGGGSTITGRTRYVVSYPNGQTAATETVYDASGTALSQMVHTMAGSPLDALQMTDTACMAWNEGLELQTDLGLPAQITLKNSYSPQTGCMNSPQLVNRTIILVDTNQVSGSSYAYDAYDNVVDQKDYDWGNGSPGAFFANSNGPICPRSIRSMPRAAST